MSEYDFNQNAMQQPVQAQNGNQEINEASRHIKEILSSNMMFAAAIIVGVQIFCLILAGIIEDVLGAMIGLSVPFIVAAVELWVTFGTAKWGKSGIKRGGIITGKVFSIIYIIGTGFVILFNLICVIAWSVFSQIIGNAIDGAMKEVLGFGDMFGDLASLSNGIVFVYFLLTMIPLILNIVLQAQLNGLRNKVIDAIEDKLTKTPKTIGTAVIMFLVGLPLIVFALILLFTGFQTSFSTTLIGIAYTLAAAMYFYGGVLVIKCGKGR